VRPTPSFPRCVAYTLCAALVVVSAALTSCTRFARFARKSTDKAAYRIIQEKQKRALGKAEDFTIEHTQGESAKRLLESAKRVDPLKESVYTTPTCTLALADALAIALANNRGYQSSKEDLYASALSLTQSRYDFSPIFSAGGSGDFTRAESGHHTATGPSVEKFGSYDYAIGLSKKVALTGAAISANFTHGLTRFFNVHVAPSSTNNAAFTIIQPLLNGAGPLVAGESLRQSERNMLYAVRSFRRTQQSFLIDTAAGYYQLLGALDQLNNEYFNYQSAVVNRERVEMYALAGRTPEIEADQARQREFQAANSWNNAQADYLRLLDQFKSYLSLPLDLDVGPDPRELTSIAERGLVMPQVNLAEAVKSALSRRLDLQNADDQLEDANRGVKIAFRNFLPTLNAGYSYTTSRDLKGDRVDIDFQNNTQNWGLDLTLPLDWTPRRNSYRQALIEQARAMRAVADLRDKVMLEVRDAWRQLERSGKNYEIQLRSVRLADRRVEGVSLSLAAGRATTRDLLDAQSDQLQAKNLLTAALVDHTIQRMRFWNAIERLEVDPKGMWYQQ